jgi:hypothetical protein
VEDRGDRGASVAEVTVSVALLAAVLLAAAPAVAHLRDAGRAGSAARALATMLEAQRFKSVAARSTRGLYFESVAGVWTWREVADGNGNGLRTAEIRSGVDPTLGAVHRIDELVERVRLGFPEGGSYPEIPPGTGTIRTSDPVQFGVSDIVSFSPLGSSSSGTLYLTDGGTALAAVVLYGPTVRVRVFRFDPMEKRWAL